MSQEHGQRGNYDHQQGNRTEPTDQPGPGLGEVPPPRPHLQPLLQRSLAPTSRAPPRRVDHTYHDYSNFPLSELPNGKKAPTNFPSKLHQILSTPEYSHVSTCHSRLDLLFDIQDVGIMGRRFNSNHRCDILAFVHYLGQQIISWMVRAFIMAFAQILRAHGRAWKIHSKELLIRDVVPKYFVQSKYESFTRQLNGWGFKRLHQSGNDFNAYYHECFLRALPHLTVLLKRVPPNKGKLLPHVEGEPNFYEIDKQFPLPSMVHYQGQYPHYPPSHHMASAAGYGAPPPELPPEYHSPNHYSSHYPSNYPPPPPYYGHPGDPHAAAAYASLPGYPPYSYYPAQYSHSPHEHNPHYPYPPGPPYNSPSHYDDVPPNNTSGGPVKSEEEAQSTAPYDAHEGERAVQEGTTEFPPIKDEREDNPFEPLSILAESENTITESSENDLGKESQY
ncbi:hypothetical protein ACHAXR_005478 [Thalassiosira sp. AJA248-18]